MNRHFRTAIGTLPVDVPLIRDRRGLCAQTHRIAIHCTIPRTCGCASPRVRAGCVCDGARRGRRAVSTAVECGLFSEVSQRVVSDVTSSHGAATSGFRCAVVIIV